MNYPSVQSELFENRTREWRPRPRRRNDDILADSGAGYSNRNSDRDAIQDLTDDAPHTDPTGG